MKRFHEEGNSDIIWYVCLGLCRALSQSDLRFEGGKKDIILSQSKE